MGFPVATAYYKNTQICQATSRSKGFNIHMSCNKPSLCAEYRLYKIMSAKFPEILKKKGRKLVIIVDINGNNSKPCKNCKNFYRKLLPLCKIKFKENGQYIIKIPTQIDKCVYCKGVKKYNKKYRL